MKNKKKKNQTIIILINHLENLEIVFCTMWYNKI